MNGNIAKSGNSGPKVRSDCEMSLELREEGGIIIDLKSKVGVLYGESIRKQCIEILNYYQISNAVLAIDDSGALPFVISARLE
jgi:citrate lyase subunit beta/citryl-CoA lyase